MSDIRPDPFHCRVAAPSVALLRLIHDSFSDPISRCAAVAAEVFCRWQLGGQSLTKGLPSALLVNVGPHDPDPVWQLIGQNRGTAQSTANREASVKVMQKLVAGRNTARPDSSFADGAARSEWRSARKAGFGSARCGGYAAMWEPSLGLITGPSHDVVLQLNSAADYELFRKDVHSRPERLVRPVGRDDRLRPVVKTAAVYGSIASKCWDRELVTDILAYELPVLFLPHAARRSSPIQNMLGPLLTGASFISPWEHQTRQIAPMISLPQWTDRLWLKHLESMLQSRSHFLPPGYQFFLLRTIRELIPICIKIAAQVPEEQLPVKVATLLASDLLQMTIRSVVAGVECLTWHCWGLAGGTPSPDLLKVLKVIRNEGTISRQQLKQKTNRIKARGRDEILDVLLHHGLVSFESRGVSAIPLIRFVEDTYRLSGPPLELLTTPFYVQMTGMTR